MFEVLLNSPGKSNIQVVRMASHTLKIYSACCGVVPDADHGGSPRCRCCGDPIKNIHGVSPPRLYGSPDLLGARTTLSRWLGVPIDDILLTFTED